MARESRRRTCRNGEPGHSPHKLERARAMTFKGTSFHRKGKKYTESDIERMEHMRYVEKMSFDEIGAEWNVTGRAIENQLYERGGHCADKPMKVPHVKKWNFKGMDVEFSSGGHGSTGYPK